MATGPQDPAAADHGRFRATDADREQVTEALKDAFAHGRLTRDEFDARTDGALAARTYADLAALTADIPPGQDVSAGQDISAGQAAARPELLRARSRSQGRGQGRPQRHRRPLVRAAVVSGICAVIVAAAIWAHSYVDPGNTPTPYGEWSRWLFLLAFSATMTALGSVAYGVAAALEQRRSRRELPPSPGAGGPAVTPNGPKSRPGTDPLPPGQHHDQSRTDLRVREPARRRISARAGRPRGVRPAPGAA